MFESAFDKQSENFQHYIAFLPWYLPTILQDQNLRKDKHLDLTNDLVFYVSYPDLIHILQCYLHILI